MTKKFRVVSEINSDIKTILNEPGHTLSGDGEKIFTLSALRARLFKAQYTAREINATLAGFLRKGLIKAISDQENEPDYTVSRKLYE